MASGSVFSGALRTITSTKLEELSKHRTTFNKQYDSLLAAVKAEQDPLKRLDIVVDGTKSCLGVKTAAHKDESDRPRRVIFGGTRNGRLETDLRTVDRFLHQARFDPSVSIAVLEDWEKKLLQYVSVQSTKYEYADLYGKLVTEWLSSEKKGTTPAADGDVEMDESFAELPSTKRLEARREWEKSVLEPATVDVPTLEAYLQKLFVTDKKRVEASLKDLREKVEDFEISLTSSSQFNTSTLRWVITSLQTSDLLSNEKREVLGDFLSNDVILSEIADVLNMRLDALAFWTWGEHVLLEQRLQINGQFQIHMHEDILQAIFLHYIGVKWSVFFKEAFLALRSNSKTWQSNRADVPKSDKMRRGYFLGDKGQSVRGNLNGKHSKIQRKRYFTNQLLDDVHQQIQHNEGEEEADFTDFVQERPRKRAKQTARKSAPAVQATVAARMAMPVMAPRRAPAPEECEEEDEDRGYALFDGGGDSCLNTDEVEAEFDSDDDDEDTDKNPMEAKQRLLHILAMRVLSFRTLLLSTEAP